MVSFESRSFHKCRTSRFFASLVPSVQLKAVGSSAEALTLINTPFNNRFWHGKLNFGSPDFFWLVYPCCLSDRQLCPGDCFSLLSYGIAWLHDSWYSSHPLQCCCKICTREPPGCSTVMNPSFQNQWRDSKPSVLSYHLETNFDITTVQILYILCCRLHCDIAKYDLWGLESDSDVCLDSWSLKLNLINWIFTIAYSRSKYTSL